MTTYIEQKVAEALSKSGNSMSQATEYLMHLAQEDEVLYAGLTGPLLKSGAMLALQRHLSGNRRKSNKSKTPTKRTEVTSKDLENMITHMGDTQGPTGKPSKSSPEHRTNLTEIANAFKKPTS